MHTHLSYELRRRSHRNCDELEPPRLYLTVVHAAISLVLLELYVSTIPQAAIFGR